MGFTNKEQAAELVRLGLPADTCDMAFEDGFPRPLPHGEPLPEGAEPCWSCDGLFALLPMEVVMDRYVWRLSVQTQKEDGMYIVSYACGGNALSKNSTVFFDAVYAMMVDVMTYFKEE